MKKLLILFAVASTIALACIPATAQTLPQTAAQVKVLTSRVTDLVTQINKLTADNKAMSDQLKLVTDDRNTTKVWLLDFGCKWNAHLELIASKQALTEFINANPPWLVVEGKACDKVSPAPKLEETQIKLWPSR
jgi:outer membrane murein-binding lipoprotein Lpp